MQLFQILVQIVQLTAANDHRSCDNVHYICIDYLSNQHQVLLSQKRLTGHYKKETEKDADRKKAETTIKLRYSSERDLYNDVFA